LVRITFHFSKEKKKDGSTYHFSKEKKKKDEGERITMMLRGAAKTLTEKVTHIHPRIIA
jgi:hypothetical protein